MNKSKYKNGDKISQKEWDEDGSKSIFSGILYE